MRFFFCPTRATWPAHLILIYLLNSSTGAKYKSCSSSSCSILQSAVTSGAPCFRTHSSLVLHIVTLTECDTCTDKNVGSLNWSCVKQMYRAFLEIATASSRVLQTVKPNWYFERDRRTPGSGVFRLPSTFLWLRSRNCGWRRCRTRRSLLQPMFRRQLCS